MHDLEDRPADMKHDAQSPMPRFSGAFVVRVWFVMATLVIGFASHARADVTYTYTGNPFTTFVGTLDAVRQGSSPRPCSTASLCQSS
jgi:hypothetical protein